VGTGDVSRCDAAGRISNGLLVHADTAARFTVRALLILNNVIEVLQSERYILYLRWQDPRSALEAASALSVFRPFLH
jgi:hypothetical protein